MDPFSGAIMAGLGFGLLLMMVVPLALMVLVLVYVALRIRDAKAETPDPELGLKTAYWFLYTLGILILHMGAMILVSYWLQQLELTGPARPAMGGFNRVPPAMTETGWSAASRTGWAVLLSGGLITGAFYLIGALGTRDSEWPTVRRVFTGSRIAVGGMIVVFSFTFLFVMQFQKELPPGGIYETALAALAVWLPSLAIHVFLFRWGGTPAYYVPPPSKGRNRSRYVDEDEGGDRPKNRRTPRDEDEAPPPSPAVDEDRTENDEEERPRRRRPRDDD